MFTLTSSVGTAVMISMTLLKISLFLLLCNLVVFTNKTAVKKYQKTFDHIVISNG